jgi:hypothetical protein
MEAKYDNRLTVTKTPTLPVIAVWELSLWDMLRKK